MHKIVAIYIGALHIDTVYSITEIHSDEECVILPSHKGNTPITHLGFEQDSYKDTRSDYERWKDEYYYNYYPTRYEVAVEVSVPPNVKKIVIPATVTHISKSAFQNVTDMVFEIDEKNEVYTVSDNKIIEKGSGEVIWPYSK